MSKDCFKDSVRAVTAFWSSVSYEYFHLKFPKMVKVTKINLLFRYLFWTHCRTKKYFVTEKGNVKEPLKNNKNKKFKDT